ncbi:MAG: hypothetical protein GKC10_05485 [Methanosarcinales archaeon]|nr:hypothetical protein [Methanosarcinales archaeon]
MDDMPKGYDDSPSVEDSISSARVSEVSEVTRTKYTPELELLLKHAVLINSFYEDTVDLTFTSMLFAFLSSQDRLSKWFQSYVMEARVDLSRRMAEHKVSWDVLKKVKDDSRLQDISNEQIRLSSSSQSLLGIAEGLRGHGDEDLDVRHLMAAYIYDPAGHKFDLDQMGFRDIDWSNAFLSQMSLMHPEEIDHWKKEHLNKFKIEPRMISSDQGPSAHIATDRWTLEDTLGYRAYAFAIYRFMTHKETLCPLTISIQAPWGGGKTSLMRMIQRHLDPTAIQDIMQSDPVPMGFISIGEVLKDIKYWKDNKKTQDLPQARIAPADEEKPHKLTIWFNAWKYQSTREVWAGLADAIIHQVSARLTPVERETFWLRLNLKRIDADKIRQQVHERILNYTWQNSLPWLVGSFLLLLTSIGITLKEWSSSAGLMEGIGGLGIMLSVLGGGFSVKAKFDEARRMVEGEPAAVSLSQYLQMPDYRSELGFIHQVEADLRLVFESIPKEHRPIVVFIDDLDRCLPQKISDVIEGINLFLAGDFPECMFVIGMDTEMVAAALKSAHAQVLSYLPLDATVPIGWRFMDKFVQLPFIIPPAESADLGRYMNSILSNSKKRELDPEVSRLAKEILPKVHDLKSVESGTAGMAGQKQISNGQLFQLREELRTSVVLENLDRGIKTFNDENEELCGLISKSAYEFSDNPRDIKRFINAFRFQYFLRWARLARELDAVSLDQLQRWVVLMMKWPDVVRWFQHGRHEGTIEVSRGPLYSTRLQQLEKMGENAINLQDWQQNAREILKTDEKELSWLKDDALRQFFYREYHQYPEGIRLSDGAGKGLW